MTSTHEVMLPLYEGKMIHHYDHRALEFTEGDGTRELTDADREDWAREPLPRYWVRHEVVKDRLHTVGRDCLFTGFRDVTNATNERTVIAALFPVVAVGNTLPLILRPTQRLWLAALLSSLVFDYLARQKIAGTHLNFLYLKQLAILPPATFNQQCPWGEGTLGEWVSRRVLALSCTSRSMIPLAREVTGEDRIYRWDTEAREQLRAELDAAMFYLFGIEEDDADYIMETFPIVKRQDEEAHGSYRTKERILALLTALKAAARTQQPYRGPLEPEDLIVEDTP
ncbi:MAG: hypothetical protein Q4P36_08675 [Bowdeniella nasicola]|nr:hypothetical protein [Bowdeniella nasicola]